MNNADNITLWTSRKPLHHPSVYYKWYIAALSRQIEIHKTAYNVGILTDIDVSRIHTRNNLQAYEENTQTTQENKNSEYTAISSLQDPIVNPEVGLVLETDVKASTDGLAKASQSSPMSVKPEAPQASLGKIPGKFSLFKNMSISVGPIPESSPIGMPKSQIIQSDAESTSKPISLSKKLGKKYVSDSQSNLQSFKTQAFRIYPKKINQPEVLPYFTEYQLK